MKMFKYADDTAIWGMINNNDESTYRSNIDRFIKWCDDNFLQINPSKTKEIIIDFRAAPPKHEPVTIRQENIEIVPKFKYLGTTIIDNKLTWRDECRSIVAKAHTRMFYLRKLGSLHVDKPILRLFYKSTVESIFLFNCVIWFGACKKEDFKKMQSVVKRASKIIGSKQDLEVECKNLILNKAKDIMSNSNHNLKYLYEFLPSGRRLRSLKCRTSRYSGSYVPFSIRLQNQVGNI